MACCIIAAYLLALLKAKVRAWAVFLGVLRPQEGDDRDTIWRRLLSSSSRTPRLRTTGEHGAH